MHVRAVVPI